MPIYEYRCASCGFEKEYLQKVSDPLLTDCPECGRGTFTKLVSAAGFQLKGNGWYVTDFRNKDGGAGKSGTNKSEDKPAETKKEEKSEAKSGTGAAPAST